MSLYNGILSTKDPDGSCIGMQVVARAFLKDHDIDITTQGPEKDTAWNP